MTDATGKLRSMLNERLIEYEVDDAKTVKVTRWKAYGDWVSFIEYDNSDTKFCIDARRLTPEQAIEATLGPRTCRKLPSSGETRCFVSRHGYEMEFGYWKCSNCGVECFEGAKYCMNCGAKVVDCGTQVMDYG